MQDARKSRVHDLASPWKVKPQMETEPSATGAPEAKGGHASWDITDTGDLKQMKDSPSMKMLGNVIISLPPRAIQKATETRDSNSVARVMLESTLHQEGKPTESYGLLDHVMAMDYARPHKKPPINNHES
ncbi:hypothetical protein Dimus_008925 [Dionaea muscipula]